MSSTPNFSVVQYLLSNLTVDYYGQYKSVLQMSIWILFYSREKWILSEIVHLPRFTSLETLVVWHNWRTNIYGIMCGTVGLQ
jgi:hypothetical protein